MSQEFAQQPLGEPVSTLSWERWLETLDEAAREAAVERAAIMEVDGGLPRWLAQSLARDGVVLR